IWGCEASPVDRRLLAVFIILSGLFLLSGLILNASAQFSAFADRLRTSRQIGASETFRETGLSELNSIVEAMNHYRELEKKHLEERALVLSGVTHDLGTPALRLKFRAELIEDPELRAKLHKDIDQMTGILESVLTFTRAELSVEEPRQISLTSLVQSIVSDFKDFEQPVEYIPSQKLKVEGGSSLFMTRRSKTELSDTTQIVLKARPVALRRAVSNLVENAVKYGRRANVYLKADASYARIVVEDEGGASFPEELEAAMAPFKRGKNATPIKGFGLGLTIASSIALSHGGTIEFNQTSKGLAVQLSVSRSL
ncbi:MAG: sensor histidine kinase, partial [Alphaproteobacteria bacterium]